MVNLIINGQQKQAREGATLLDVIQEMGIEIPTLCHDPDLEAYGGCRMCVVELSANGKTWITTACNYPVQEGLVVKTDSERALETRRVMADLHLSRTPRVPAIQRLAASVGVLQPSFQTDTPNEDCVLCGLCVRACNELAQKDVLGLVERGPARYVTTALETHDPICDTCNQCVTYCPTGAITRLPKVEIGLKAQLKKLSNKRIRQGVQYGLLAIFLVLFGLSSQAWAAEFSSAFSKANLLQALTATIASRSFITTFIPAIFILILTLAVGRVWCGWICPMGAILELFGPVGTRKLKDGWRQVKYWILAVILLMSFAGSLWFMFMEPITVLIRGLANTVGMVQAIITNGFYPAILLGLLATIPFFAALGLNAVEKRFWCRYLCPLGALLGFLSKFSFLNRVVNEKSCVKCGDCVKTCPMGAINSETIKQDPAECVMCLSCAPVCPKLAISYTKKQPKWGFEYDPTKRELIGSAVTAAAAVGVLQIPLAKTTDDNLLRPPGIGLNESDFLSKCIRCQQCVEACATHVLHPRSTGMGWGAFWTPALDPTLGYCNYDCNRCGQVCPSNAIPNLTLEMKRQQKIGQAVVDEQLCINCMVCREVCPTKAVEEIEIQKQGKPKPLPKVLPDKCIGCGLCEFKCPVPPAIAVYALNSPQAVKARKGG